MSSGSDDNHTTRHSSEHYDIVGADLDWFIILATSCTIFFGFLLKIAVNPPSYFRLFDSIILLTALYAVTVATIMFILPVIYHASSYLPNINNVFGFRISLKFQAASSDCIPFSFISFSLYFI